MGEYEKRLCIAKEAISNALGTSIENFRYEVVGSTYIKDNHKSDIDVLVLVKDICLECTGFEGWEYGGSVGMGNDHWMSWKKYTVDGVEVNMLLTTDEQYFYSWLTAAEVCRFLHLQGYDIRTSTVHGIHEIIMDDSTAEVEHLVRNY